MGVGSLLAVLVRRIGGIPDTYRRSEVRGILAQYPTPGDTVTVTFQDPYTRRVRIWRTGIVRRMMWDTASGELYVETDSSRYALAITRRGADAGLPEARASYRSSPDPRRRSRGT